MIEPTFDDLEILRKLYLSNKLTDKQRNALWRLMQNYYETNK